MWVDPRRVPHDARRFGVKMACLRARCKANKKGDGRMGRVTIVMAAVLLVLGMSGVSFGKDDAAVVADGKEVAFEYTLTVDGKVVDSSKGKEPLKFLQGSGQIIPGLAKQLNGMKIGDEKNVVLAPEDGYGPVNPKAFKEFPITSLPQGMSPQSGMIIQMSTPDGRAFPVKIAEVKKDTVLIDLNHPLAGKTLNFNIKIVSIN